MRLECRPKVFRPDRPLAGIIGRFALAGDSVPLVIPDRMAVQVKVYRALARVIPRRRVDELHFDLRLKNRGITERAIQSRPAAAVGASWIASRQLTRVQSGLSHSM